MHPSPKRQRLPCSPGAGSSQDTVAVSSQVAATSWSQGSLASPSQGLSQSSECLTPGRSGERLSRRLVDEWGACYRCRQYGHFAADCIVGSQVFSARYDTICQVCNGGIKDMDSCYLNADLLSVSFQGRYLRGNEPVHVRCEIALRQQLQEAEERARKRKRLETVEEEGAPSGALDVEGILGSIDTTHRSIGVNARAGSGKTHVIAKAAEKVRDRGERLLAVTLNRDARGELVERGVVEARTYHSYGAKAWFRKYKRGGGLVTEEDDEEAAAEEAAAAADECEADEAPTQDCWVPNKSKLLLQKLYPKLPDEGGRGTKSLDVALFESFAVKMVSLAKMEAVGIDGSGRADDEATWVQLCEMHSVGDVIETTLEKKLSRTRCSDAEQRWPTAVTRRDHGLRMARACFRASIHCALHASWEVAPGEVVTELRSSDKAKPRSLPLLDYDDLLFMPMKEGLDLDPGPPEFVPRGGAPQPTRPLRWLFADEAQDNSRIRLIMLARLMGGGGGGGVRFFGVGDDMQALYGWAFALPDALDQLFRLFNCVVHTLPVCRRCPTSHVELANGVIQAATNGEGALMRPMPDAAQGSIVRDATFCTHPVISSALVTGGGASGAAANGEEQATLVRAEKAILARRNAPLLALLFLLASKGIPCRMLGRAPLAKKLGKLLKELYYDGHAPRTLDQVESALDGHLNREQDARQGADESKGAEYCLPDLAECLRLLIGQVRQDGTHSDGEAELEALHKEIKSQFGTARGQYILPSQQVQTVELSTVHKAKGLGWPVVYLLEPGEIPLSFVVEQGGWQARQELNVMYVAYTRAERDLIFLCDVTPSPKPEDFSLRNALRDVLFGGAGGSSGAQAGGASRPHPRDDPDWKAPNAFDGWRQYHQQRAAADAGAAPDEGQEAQARALLELPLLPARLTESAIDQAYKRLALQRHPDKGGTTQQMQQIGAARDLLKDVVQRAQEDW